MAPDRTPAAGGRRSGRRGTKQQVDDRCLRMLLQALPLLVRGRAVGFEGVCGVYEDPGAGEKKLRGRFRSDLKRLQALTERFRALIAPLGYSLPRFEVRRGTLALAARPFSRLLNREGSADRRALARALVDTRLNVGHLVPRQGALFLGYGTTLYFVAQEILRREQDFARVSLFTSNFEAAALFYFSAPAAFAERVNHLSLPGSELNWQIGSLTRAQYPMDFG